MTPAQISQFLQSNAPSDGQQAETRAPNANVSASTPPVAKRRRLSPSPGAPSHAASAQPDADAAAPQQESELSPQQIQRPSAPELGQASTADPAVATQPVSAANAGTPPRRLADGSVSKGRYLPWNRKSYRNLFLAWSRYQGKDYKRQRKDPAVTAKAHRDVTEECVSSLL